MPKKLSPEELLKQRLPAETKHPLRFCINGVKDTIPAMKTLITGSELSEGLKAFLCKELDELKSNAAEVHLHDVERPDGGFDLHVSIKSVILGARANSIFKRPTITPSAVKS